MQAASELCDQIEQAESLAIQQADELKREGKMHEEAVGGCLRTSSALKGRNVSAKYKGAIIQIHAQDNYDTAAAFEALVKERSSARSAVMQSLIDFYWRDVPIFIRLLVAFFLALLWIACRYNLAIFVLALLR